MELKSGLVKSCKVIAISDKGKKQLTLFMVAKADIKLQSLLTCPNCGYQKSETMPTDACQYFYECTNCHTNLKPLTGDCCVFCSYGDVKCPPIQLGTSCCN